MQIYGIFTEYPWKIMENMRKIIPFLSISFHNLFRMTRFSRSFSVVFAVISGENWRISEKIGEYRRKMENIGDIFPFSFIFIPLSFHFITLSFHFFPFHSSTPRFSSPNVKSYYT